MTIWLFLSDKSHLNLNIMVEYPLGADKIQIYQTRDLDCMFKALIFMCVWRRYQLATDMARLLVPSRCNFSICL